MPRLYPKGATEAQVVVRALQEGLNHELEVDRDENGITAIDVTKAIEFHFTQEGDLDGLDRLD